MFCPFLAYTSSLSASIIPLSYQSMLHHVTIQILCSHTILSWNDTKNRSRLISESFFGSVSSHDNLSVFKGRYLFMEFGHIGLYYTLHKTFISTFFCQIWVSVSELASNLSPVRLVLAVSDTTVKFLYILMWESDNFAIFWCPNIFSHYQLKSHISWSLDT